MSVSAFLRRALWRGPRLARRPNEARATGSRAGALERRDDLRELCLDGGELPLAGEADHLEDPTLPRVEAVLALDRHSPDRRLRVEARPASGQRVARDHLHVG